MKIRKVNLYSFAVSVFLFLLLSNFALAQGNPNPPLGGGNPIQLTNPLKSRGNLYTFLKDIVNDILLPIGGVIVVIAIIYTGFLFVTARGNEEKLKQAKRAFLYTTIGAAILLGAWVIALAIESTIKQITP